MLVGAFVLLSLAAGLGLYLAGTNPADRGGFGHWPIVHGNLGGAGVLALLLAWHEGTLHGTFGGDAVVLVGGALVVGLVIAWFGWRDRPVPLAVILVHGALAGIGYLIVAGFALG